MSSSFETILERDGKIVYSIHGVSMEPMLRQNRDLVIIKPIASHLKNGDVALYRRGSSFVLHRVIGIKNDYYLFRGDNTYTVEKVPEECVIGVLTSFQRKGKYIDICDPVYKAYVRLWRISYPVRFCIARSYRLIIHIALRLGFLPFLKKVFRHE